jgi:hypothetical protein
MKKIILLCTSIIFLISVLILPQIAFGIGQMTQPIIKENVLRGQETRSVLILTNSGSEEEIYKLTGEGDVTGWASFYRIDDENLENPITEFAISAESSLRLVVKFTVPEDAPNGEYKGEVVLYNVPGEDDKINNTVKLTQRIGREVTIVVTDQEIIEFKTSIIPLNYSVFKNKPLQIKGIYTNKGNVSIKPEVQLKITKFDTGKVVYNAIYPYPEDQEPVRAFSTKIFDTLVEWQTTGQENGRYKADVSILLNGEKNEETNFTFSIQKSGLLGLVKGVSIGGWQINWWIISFVILVALAVVLSKKFKIKNSL